MWKKPTKTKQPDSDAAAHGYALRLLQLAWRSEAELREKLSAKGFAANVVTGAIEYMRGLGYVDDVRLAAGIARGYAESRAHGALHLQAKLLSKKVPAQVIEQVLMEHFSLEVETVAAQRALAKLRSAAGRSEQSYLETQKVMAKLHARGFRSAAIRAALASE